MRATLAPRGLGRKHRHVGNAGVELARCRSASAEEIAASAQKLARTASSLEQLVGRFTLAPSDR
jgi:hypothetical protein